MYKFEFQVFNEFFFLRLFALSLEMSFDKEYTSKTDMSNLKLLLSNSVKDMYSNLDFDLLGSFIPNNDGIILCIHYNLFKLLFMFFFKNLTNFFIFYIVYFCSSDLCVQSRENLKCKYCYSKVNSKRNDFRCRDSISYILEEELYFKDIKYNNSNYTQAYIKPEFYLPISNESELKNQFISKNLIESHFPTSELNKIPKEILENFNIYFKNESANMTELSIKAINFLILESTSEELKIQQHDSQLIKFLTNEIKAKVDINL